jgi:hypothetical protein
LPGCHEDREEKQPGTPDAQLELYARTSVENTKIRTDEPIHGFSEYGAGHSAEPRGREHNSDIQSRQVLTARLYYEDQYEGLGNQRHPRVQDDRIAHVLVFYQIPDPADNFRS